VRVIRLLEVLLHGGTHVGGWTAKQVHQAVLATFHRSERAYGLNRHGLCSSATNATARQVQRYETVFKSTVYETEHPVVQVHGDRSALILRTGAHHLSRQGAESRKAACGSACSVP
jgi:alpha-ketoglutarate-dependent taurine dioxygenase